MMDGAEYLFGIMAENNTDRLVLASSLDNDFNAVSSVTLPLSVSESCTYALYDENKVNSSVVQLEKSDVLRKTDSSVAYAAVARMNSLGTIDDIVVISLDSDSTGTINDINKLAGWKINYSYRAPDEVDSLATSPLAVVKAIGTMLDDDDNMVLSYTCVQSGEIKAVCKDCDIDAANDAALSVGDVFQYALNDDGEICDIEIVYDFRSRALTNYALNSSVNNDDVAYIFGVIAEYTGDAIKLASGVDYNLNPTAYSKFKVANTEKSTYATIEEAAAYNPVYKITSNSIRETVRFDSVNAAVVKINKNERVEDIVVIALDPYEFNSYDDINSFTNWKITY